MDEIVAVEVRLRTGESRYFLTWGRVQAKVDAAPLEALVLRHCTRAKLGGEPSSAHLCWSLQEASGETYFFESYFAMCQRGGLGVRPPSELADLMEQGKELWYLGLPVGPIGTP